MARSHVPSSSSSTDWKTPLLLSALAGLSTCLGAAVVFCAGGGGPAGQRQQQQRRRLGHGHMAFALSLAGSVMITVSVASILPECFLNDESNAVASAAADVVGDPHTNSTSTNRYVAVDSTEFWQRCLAFGVGCALYVLLSKCAFPEPDAILGWNDDTSGGNNHAANFESHAHRSDVDFLGDSDNMLLLDDELDMPEIPLLASASSGETFASTSTTTFQRKRTPADGAALDERLEEKEDSVHLKSPKRGPVDASGGERTRCPLRLAFCARFRGTDLPPEARRAWRVAMLLFLSLAVHNFPEGLAVAASALRSPRLGVTTALAIALHNIPEGIAIALPCLAARPDAPWLAFGLASLSGLAEPLGAVVALAVLGRDDPAGDPALPQTRVEAVWSAVVDMKNALSFVAGIMITVATVELFPEAKRHMKGNRVPGIVGTLTGAIVMLASDAYIDS